MQNYKLVGEFSSLNSSNDYMRTGVPQTIAYLSAQADSFAFYNNHNTSFLDRTSAVDIDKKSIVETLMNLCIQYSTLNPNSEPIIFVGVKAHAKLLRPIKNLLVSSPNGLGVLESFFPSVRANLRQVNAIALDYIKQGADKIGATVRFGEYDIVLVNPAFLQVYRGYEPSTVFEYQVGTNSFIEHVFSTPSVQLVRDNSGFKVDVTGVDASN